MTASRRAPRWLTGRPNVRRMDGQATPRTPSGRPRLTKAANAMATTRRRGGGVIRVRVYRTRSSLTSDGPAASVRDMKVALALMLLVPVASARADAQEKPPSTAELYKTHCQSCHMAGGDSPLEPLNFVDGTWKHGS